MIYRNRLLAMLSLTALLAVIVSSCNSTDEDIKVGTTVPVELALNVSTQQSTGTNTRMTIGTVQGQTTPAFRGIQDWHLIPFAITSPLPTPPIAGGNAPLSGAITPDLTQETGTYNFLDGNIIDATIGTNAYLCYARAERTDTGTPDNFANGLTVASFDDNSPQNITFSPEQICSSTVFANDTKGSALLAYLNGIAQASVNDGNNSKTWTDDGGLERIFKSLVNYDETNTTYRLYAGSSVSIKALATMAYNAVNSLSYSDNTSWQAALKTEILNKIKDGLTENTHYTIDPTTSEITITSLGDSRDGFPASVKLPDGAAAVIWDDSANPKAFKYATRTTIPEDAVTNYQALVYPAELWYYANSPIKTSKSSQASNYSNVSWTSVLSNYDTEGTSVDLDTRSIAITEPLQYGVGCIEAVVQAETTTDKLSDANSTAIPLFHLLDPNDNTSSKVYHFPLTAVLFGGQYNQNFNFTPKSEGSQCVLYDPMMVGHAADNTETGTINLKPGNLIMDNFASASDKFYTLSLQTRDNVDVNIVLEFQNNSGESFYGVNGLIAPGMHFYLVGTIKNPTTGGLPRVVTQDCKTQLIINVKSLQYAYNVIPDLNTAKTVLNVVDIAVAPWTDRGFKDHNVYNW